MCGIAGIVGLKDKRILKDKLKLMAHSISHRGPDGEGIWLNNSIGFSHKRLAIFDLSDNGLQPMTSQCGRYTIVYNGEVYNWVEIRKKIKDVKWKSMTDTETVLYAYIKFGMNFLEMLNGMFAFAIWDSIKKTLILVRDRVGIKPLFYSIHNGILYFASETKALFAANVNKRPNRETIYDFLRWGLIDHDHKTFFKNIYSLPPATCLTYNLKNKKIEKNIYWDLKNIINVKDGISPKESIDIYSELLKDSIKLRTRADVDLGSMLSGGIDSSVLTACLSRYLGKNKPISYTYDYDIMQGESKRAKQVTDVLKIPWYLKILKHESVPDYLRYLINMHEEPITSMAVLAHHKVYEEAHKHGLKILLEGHGGDELGAGYEYYYMPYIMDLLKSGDRIEVCTLINKFMNKFNIPIEKRMERIFDTLQTTLVPGISTHDGLSFVNSKFLKKDFIKEFDCKQPILDNISDSFLTNLQYKDFRYVVLPRALRYADRASMSSSLEARVPILDHRIVEFAFKTSFDSRINNFRQRYYMSKAAEKLLPNKILKRKKITIVDPQRDWLQKELRSWITSIFNSKVAKDIDFLNLEEIKKDYNIYCREKNPRTSFHFFQFMNIILWYEEMFN